MAIIGARSTVSARSVALHFQQCGSTMSAVWQYSVSGVSVQCQHCESDPEITCLRHAFIRHTYQNERYKHN